MAMSDGFDWDELLLYIRERRVIPIVGRELLISANDPGSLLDHRLALRLAQELEVSTEGLEQPTIRAVASRYLATHRNPNKIYSKLKMILDKDAPPIPEPLRLLAQISDFGLFVSTTFDGLMERAIDEVRAPGRVRAKSLSYSPFAAVQDLENVPGPRDPPAVYHILGRASPFPDYAVHDEDTLEFLHFLQSESRRPHRLFDALRDSHLLFLGCGFPDWLSRFFIRTMNGQRFLGTRNKSEVVADTRVRLETDLVGFLQQFETSVFVRGGAAEFVAELHRRWADSAGEQLEPVAAEAAAGHARRMPDGAVFLSYARENREAVRRAHDALEAVGVDAWFDDRDLGPGQWDQQIDEGIRRCALFLPFVSQDTEAAVEGYFRREWRVALDRSLGIAQTVPFIVPVSVDGTSPESTHVPPEFRSCQWTRLRDGNPDPDFVEFVKGAIRKVRAQHYR
jgi:hypothetical protein